MKSQLFAVVLLTMLTLSVSAQQAAPAAPAPAEPASQTTSTPAPATAPQPPAQKTLNNEEVIKLATAGLSDDLIATTINTSPGKYDTSTDGIIALKAAGISDKVVAAILTKAAAQAASATPVSASGKPVPAPPSLPPGVDTLGVYSQATDGSWQEFISSVVSYETSGAMKSLTGGIVKGNTSGHVDGPTSRLKLKLPANLLLYLPESISPGDYQLVHLKVESGNRVFRLVAKKNDKAANGPARDSIDFDAKKIAPRIYEIELGKDLGAGEYGLLPPADPGKKDSSASEGKIYAFTAVN